MARKVEQNVDAIPSDLPRDLLIGKCRGRAPMLCELLQTHRNCIGMDRFSVTERFHCCRIMVNHDRLEEKHQSVHAEVWRNITNTKRALGIKIIGVDSGRWTVGGVQLPTVHFPLSPTTMFVKYGPMVQIGIVIQTKQIVALRQRKIGIEPQRLQKAPLRQVKSAHGQKCRAEIDMDYRMIWSELQSLLIASDRLLEIGQRNEDHSQTVVGLGKLRV